jgi:hypothetical protein
LEVKGGSSTWSLILVVDLNDDSPQSPFFLEARQRMETFRTLAAPGGISQVATFQPRDFQAKYWYQYLFG